MGSRIKPHMEFIRIFNSESDTVRGGPPGFMNIHFHENLKRRSCCSNTAHFVVIFPHRKNIFLCHTIRKKFIVIAYTHFIL